MKISFKSYDENNIDVVYVFYDDNNEKINYVKVGKNYFVNKINGIVDASPDTLYAFKKESYKFIIDESISTPQIIDDIKYNCNKGICTVNNSNDSVNENNIPDCSFNIENGNCALLTGSSCGNFWKEKKNKN